MLSGSIKRQIGQSVQNTCTSVAAEVFGDPIRMPDGTYQVVVEMIGGGYGGRSTLVAVYTDQQTGVTGASLKSGDLVLVSFDEKGSASPRITSVISRYTAFSNQSIRSRPAVSDATRADTTSMMVVGGAP
ncbi:MAG: hypothetical protein KatS3mg023_3720 [Armatimonadota bacterium]|nr:MAG: hypothetical protein KatS3mg023_3720 [Armatimonadota bacterium]